MVAPDALQAEPEKQRGYILCSRCGVRFQCGAQAGKDTCWCGELAPVMPLPGTVDSCLCPACLKAEIALRKENRHR
jgi:hypothetical protein